MQLHFDTQELNALANIMLRERDRKGEEPAGAPVVLSEQLLDRILNRQLQFGFDELDCLLQVATRHKQRLEAQIGTATDPKLRTALDQQKALFERICDRLTEACAML